MAEVQKLDFGLYLLNDGDDAQRVARRLYGDVHKSSVLTQENPEDWDTLERIVVPNKKGRTTELLPDESVQQCIARMFPNQPVSIYMQPFFMWNGGQEMHLASGDRVFVPER